MDFVNCPFWASFHIALSMDHFSCGTMSTTQQPWASQMNPQLWGPPPATAADAGAPLGLSTPSCEPSPPRLHVGLSTLSLPLGVYFATGEHGT